MSKLLRLGRLLTLLCASPLLILVGCAGQTQIAEISPEPANACTAFARMSFSRLQDTEATIIQIKAYDAARDALCGVGK